MGLLHRYLDRLITKGALLLLATTLISAAQPVYAAIPASERQALIDLYNSTNGAGWTSQSHWTTAPGVFNAVGTECTWLGVQCDAGQTTVQTIDLATNHLTGSLPNLSAFTNLQLFYADRNSLTGPIPAISSLKNLQAFSIYSNHYLTGPIPSIAGLTNLQMFLAGHNQLTGTIPPLTGLTNLQFFSAGYNQLTGGIPSLSGLTSLQSFAAAGNQLSGSIPSLAGLANLRNFEVENNVLSGSIPALAGLTNLQYFQVDHNQLTGTIPALSGLTNLQTFYASSNQLTGQMPSLAGLVNLQDFEIDHNLLTGTTPSLTELTSLQFFAVAFNQFSGALSSAPASLIAGYSTVCPNSFTPTPDPAWDKATGVSPWYQGCTTAPLIVTPSAGPNGTIYPSTPVTVASGATTTFSVYSNPGYSANIGGTCGPPLTSNLSGGGMYYTTKPITSNCTVAVTFIPNPTLTLTSSVNPSVFGQSVTFSAALTGGQSPTGAVTVFDGARYSYNPPQLGTGVVSNNFASVTTGNLSAGQHSISANYGGDAYNYSAWGELTSAQVVKKAATTLTLNVPAAGAYPLMKVSLKVVAPGAGSPSGTIIVSDGKDSCTITLPQTTCLFVITDQAAKTLTATYEGDANFEASSSSVNLTQTTLISSANPSVVGQDVTFTAVVAQLNGNQNPTGSVTLVVDNVTIGTGVLVDGKATFHHGFGSGWLTVTARYDGDAFNAGSIVGMTQVVNLAATTTVVSAPQIVAPGQAVKVSAQVSVNLPGAGVPSGVVNVTDGGTQNCSFTLPATSCSLAVLSEGVTTLKATYGGDANFAASTGTTTLTVHGTSGSTTLTTLNSSMNPSPQNQAIEFVAAITGSAPTGSVTFQDGANILCNASPVRTIKNNQFAYCVAKLSGAAVHSITANYSGDSVNAASSSAVLSQVVTGASPFNANQFGVSGSWYNAATSGQGLEIEVLPDYLGAGKGVFFAGWFTYDANQSGAQRWYTLQGTVDNSSASAMSNIYQATGGNFNAPPKVGTSNVGTATMVFADCTHATLNYTFTDGSGRSGSIPLTRLLAATSCTAAGDNSVSGTDYFLSGAWYDAATSGQGIVLDVSPGQAVLAGAWYTYAKNGQNIGGGGSQRWFTIQTNSYVPGSRSATNVPIYAAHDGVFDDPTPITNPQVGSANITFSSCSAMNLSYTFTAGELAGQSGTIAMTPVGPVPKGCQ